MKGSKTKATGAARTSVGSELHLSPISVGQQLSQAGFVFVFFGVLFVLRPLYRRRRAQHRPRRRFHRARYAEFL